MIKQVSMTSREYMKERGVHFGVAIRQTGEGNSEDHARRVAGYLITIDEGLFNVSIGGDTWDNPCMCVAWFVDRRHAERTNKHFVGSILFEI